MFIQIVPDDDAFEWQPLDEESGKPYDSTFSLRIVSDEIDKEIRKRHTRDRWEKKTRQMRPTLDDAAYITDILDHAIVGWAGIKNAKTGAELPCNADMKARLPERWKAEILRLCSGKEAGDVIAKAEDTKKNSLTTSSGSETNSRIRRAV